MDKKWGRDLSCYNPKAEYKKMHAEGESFIIARLSYGVVEDPLFKRHYDGAGEAGTALMSYSYIDPTVNVARQVDRIIELMLKYNIVQGWGDIEQYISDWLLYYQALAGKIPLASVPKFSPEKLNGIYKPAMFGIRERFPGFGGYSARWFGDGYCPGMALWIGLFRHWLAYYVDRGQKAYQVTLDGLRGMIDALPETPPERWVTTGVTRPLLWQFTSRVILPGDSAPSDINVFLGTADEWYAMTNQKVTDTPPEPKPATLQAVIGNCSYATVYTASTGGVACAWPKAGTVVTVMDVRDGRAQIGALRWVNVKYIVYR